MTDKNFQPPTDGEIARYAYCLWEAEGQIHGRDLDYWLQAKAHLMAAREHEAGLLEETGTPAKPQTVAAPVARLSLRTSRRRQNRLVREAEPVCA